MSYLRPYFMTNEEWYNYDKKTKTYTLTDKAPEEAVKSYNDFMEYISHPFSYGMTDEDKAAFVEQELAQLEKSDDAIKDNRHYRKHMRRLEAEKAKQQQNGDNNQVS